MEESKIERSNNELRSKDGDIKQMENIILEKSGSIASLQNKIEAPQVDRLKKEIETPNIAEKKIQELNLKLENLQKVSNEQKARIHKTEKALQVAEEEMMKAELAATFMKSLKLLFRLLYWNLDYQRRLPHWLLVNLNHFQSLIVAHWKNFWRPALDASFPEILVKTSQVRREGEIFIEMLETEWIPVMKDQWLTFISSLSSHFESLAAKTIEAYHVTKNSLLSHTVKIQKAAAPFIQEAHKFAKPYINQIETVTKPYIDMAVVTLEPYSGKTLWAYRVFVTSVISCHNQVQQLLKTNELTRSLASMQLGWFAATALLCLPVVCLCRLCSGIFRKNIRKFRRISHSNNIRRKLKRPLNID